MFVDASAIIAILTDEPERALLQDRLAQAEDRCTSAIALWEAAIRLTSKSDLSEVEALGAVRQFLDLRGIDVTPIGDKEADLAVEAQGRFGKRNHPAALNMGDCFAYACAKARKMPLLYIGNDFSQTDINDDYA